MSTITVPDTRAAWIKRISAFYARFRDAWHTTEIYALKLPHETSPDAPMHSVELFAWALGVAPGKLRKWLRNSPDLASALEAEGLVQ